MDSGMILVSPLPQIIHILLSPQLSQFVQTGNQSETCYTANKRIILRADKHGSSIHM